MKKLTLILVLLFTSTMCFAQIIGGAATQQWNGSSNINGNIFRNGNVGIGNTSPTEKLDVSGNIKAEKANFKNYLPDGSTFIDHTDRNLQCNVLRAGFQLSSSGSLFNFLDFPQSNLNTQSQSFMGIEDRNYKSRFRFYANTGGSSEQVYYDKNQSSFYSLSEDGNNNVFLKLTKENSYVTIGTNSYQDNDNIYKLSVNGKMRAESVKVYTSWADFVFESDYKLPSLKEVENHINTFGHLKDIPSAKQVEENGIDLGEINKLLLQKIEELTLYLIEKDKEILKLNNDSLLWEKNINDLTLIVKSLEQRIIKK